ncbi:MAG: sigma 54-interacting transcriptional regulator [Deltaproteobacteria bacterium]|nr:sigma 54-interacting transcriptional regulator [Deltaproteobacteria bacterium]
MTDDKDRFTATLRHRKAAEVMTRRPGLVALRVDDADGQRDCIVKGPRATIGAHPSNALVVRDDAVSSVHLQLQIDDGGGATLRDLGSKNGTWVGGARVRDVWLGPGCSFRAGACTITLVGIDPVEVPVSTVGRFGDLYGRGSKMGELFAKLERLASIPLDILVVGETGTGKELVARGLHTQSSRKDGPLVVLDCTILNEGVVESTLFGHCKGTFTGALTDQPGLLEQADGGTLFIDEISELPLPLQPKLLRALENHSTRRIGETAYRTFDARIVAATNRDLRRMVNEGMFRADLYFRLAQIQLEVAPLRDRGKGDVALLADLFLDRFAKERGVDLRFANETYSKLASHDWPGNVRELRNAIRYAAMLTEGRQIDAEDLPPLHTVGPDTGASSATGVVALEQAMRLPIVDARVAFERVYVARAMTEAQGNQSEAARRIGMSRSAFRDLIRRIELG